MHGLAGMTVAAAFAGNARGGSTPVLMMYSYECIPCQLQGFHTQPCTCTCTWLYHYILVLSTSMHCIIVYTFAYILTSSVQYVLCPQNMIVHMNTYTCSFKRRSICKLKAFSFQRIIGRAVNPFFCSWYFRYLVCQYCAIANDSYELCGCKVVPWYFYRWEMVCVTLLLLWTW